jgi:SAM-dependent methyltransferase
MEITLKKVVQAIKNPVLTKEKIYNLILDKFKKTHGWLEVAAGSFKRKKYDNYEEYVNHQRSKLDLVKERLVDYNSVYRDLLRVRLAEDHLNLSGKNALCLAARLGTEVRSFLDLGCFAVGIDLNPGKINKYVVTGDFHALQYPDSCVDVIFCNSLDHVFDLSLLLAEAKRVLKKDGMAIFEIVKGSKEGGRVGYWESLSWEKVDDVAAQIENIGFTKIRDVDFIEPWAGRHMVFVRHE